MKEFTREHRAVLDFSVASARVGALVREEENMMFTRFYSAFESGIAYFIESELNIRQGERCAVLGVKKGIQDASLAQGQEMNRRGIEMLGIAQSMFAEFSKTIPQEPPTDAKFQAKLADAKFQVKLAEFQGNVREIFADLEIKASDARELDGVLTEVITAASTGKSANDIALFLDAKVKTLAEVRSKDGRGAETNIAVWKLVAAAVFLCIAAWVVYRCYYSPWPCSTSEQALYSTVFAFATVVFGACE